MVRTWERVFARRRNAGLLEGSRRGQSRHAGGAETDYFRKAAFSMQNASHRQVETGKLNM
jgi:hypothetical protein